MAALCLLVCVFAQVCWVQKVLKETLAHRDIQDSEALMDWKETEEQMGIQVLGSRDIQEKR